MSTTASVMQRLLAPLLQQNALDMSSYGGAGNLGLNLLAGNPAPYRMPAAMSFARSALSARGGAEQAAAARLQLAHGALGLKRAAMTLPFLGQYYQGLLGMLSGAPSGAPANASVSANGAPPSSAAAPAGAAPAGAPAASVGADPMRLLRMATFGSAIGAPGASALGDLAKMQLEYDPATALRMALAKDPLTVDRAMLQRSLAAGDQPGARAAYIKFLKDAGQIVTNGYSGTITTLGGITPQQLGMASVNPARGTQIVGGVESNVPGSVAANAAREGAAAGAQQSARLRAETAPAGGPAPAATGGGTASVSTAPAAGTAPQTGEALPPPLQGAGALAAQNFIPPVLAAPAAIPQAPGNTSLTALKEMQEAQGESAPKVAEALQDKAETATQLLAQTQQIEAAAARFGTGKFADARAEVLNVLNSLGLLTPAERRAFGSYQEGTKLSIQLQALATKQLGSREAAQIFSVMGKSIPNLTLSQDGLAKIAAYLKGIARYDIARATFAQRLLAQGNAAGLTNLPQAFQTYSNPLYYIIASAPKAVQQEMIGDIPAVAKQKFGADWSRAIQMGLAPRPGDYRTP